MVHAALESYELDRLDTRQILRFLGYRGQELDDATAKRVDAAAARALELATPKASWRSYAIAGREPGAPPKVMLAGSVLTLAGEHIGRHLDGAAEAVVLAVTAGIGIDRELRRLALTDAIAEALLDAAGTVAVEAAADAASASIRAWAEARGLRTGARFSPGYGDLPLACQPELLASVDAGRQLGITLTESLLMVPVKSVTAIIGVFEQEEDARAASERSGSLD